ETPIDNQAEAARGNVADFCRPQGIVTGSGRDRITGHRQVAGIAHPHAAVGRRRTRGILLLGAGAGDAHGGLCSGRTKDTWHSSLDLNYGQVKFLAKIVADKQLVSALKSTARDAK